LTVPLSNEEKLTRALERKVFELKQAKSLNKTMLRRGGFAFESVIEDLRKVLSEEQKEPFQITVTPEKVGAPLDRAHTETAALALSDWHLSELVKPSSSNGINSYSTMTCANRVSKLGEKTVRIINLHRKLYTIEELWIVVLGDMISGSIHPELLLTNELTDSVATILSARLLQMLVMDLKQLNIPIRIDCVVGNHSRMLAKMPTKAQASLSYDWMIYEMLADYFSKDSSVNVNVHTGQIAQVQKYNWKYILEHGMEVSSSKEEDFEDRIRALFDDPTYREATGLKGSAFDQIVIGNMHKPKILERTIVNGSLVGQNELGMSWRLKPIRAQQMLWGISKSHVRTWHYPIDLTSVRSEKGDNKYSLYTKSFMRKHAK